jgi:REP element-mobilizing transposase RayT
VEDRLRELAGIFPVQVGGFAVMSNHLHVVLRMRPQEVATWPAEEVVRRWWQVYPRRAADGTALPVPARALAEQAKDLAWVAERRRRLGEVGWLMKALKETISRRANKEDGCTGAFWEGRFSSVPLLDDAALLACMAYVDLNPVRAGIAATPETSAHTGGRLRTRAWKRWTAAEKLRKRGDAAGARKLLEKAGLASGARDAEDGLWLAPVGGCTTEDASSGPEGRGPGEISSADAAAGGRGRPRSACMHTMTAAEHLELLDATGRSLVQGKRGRIDARLGPILARLDLQVEDWIATMLGWRMLWGGSAIGTAASRAVEAARRGLDWIRNRCPLFAA